MIIKVFRLVLILILLLAGCSTGTQKANLPNCTSYDCDCRDFATQEEAQRVLDAFDGNSIVAGWVV